VNVYFTFNSYPIRTDYKRSINPRDHSQNKKEPRFIMNASIPSKTFNPGPKVGFTTHTIDPTQPSKRSNEAI
jgi:hypothetical protein